MMDSTEFILLAGFLGSGKTSLLVDWLGLPDAANTAVIVNEAGEIDVDGAIVAEGGTLPMAMLANGCVCCSMTSDLVFTVRALIEERARAGHPPFARIVLECSGLSRPGPILRSLLPLAPLGLTVRVVSTCDASQAVQHAAYFEEVSAQLAAAGTIVLTKLDLSSAEAAAALAASINPLATCVVETDRTTRARSAFRPAAVSGAMPEIAGSTAHPRVAVLRATFTDAASWEDRLDWMEDLAAFCGDRLLRVKGFVRPPGSTVPLLVQAVGSLFAPPLPMPGSPDLPEGLVVITRDLGAAALRGGMPSPLVRIAAMRESPLTCAPVAAT
ncbi:CobW family GTP-binding protein [Muricoccus vinaceus]|uniref:CobW family GTP-binding protein n=1 Tax=Muricoccus vinaceus TaxID=424704 RepID=A0ABV6IV66_9PROT